MHLGNEVSGLSLPDRFGPARALPPPTSREDVNAANLAVVRQRPGDHALPDPSAKSTYSRCAVSRSLGFRLVLSVHFGPRFNKRHVKLNHLGRGLFLLLGLRSNDSGIASSEKDRRRQESSFHKFFSSKTVFASLQF